MSKKKKKKIVTSANLLRQKKKNKKEKFKSAPNVFLYESQSSNVCFENLE